MKATAVLFISILCLGAQGYLIKVPTTTTNTGVAAGGWVHIQKLLLPLFENVCEESTEPIVMRLNEEFKVDPTSGVYLNPEVVGSFQSLKSKGLLAKGEIFTEYNPNHLNELKVIYELLYYARDFDTFYKAACWARQNVNCGLFVDAIYLAILNRRDTEKVSVPAPYEVLPNYFIKKDFVVKASSLIGGEAVSLSDSVRNEGNAYILDVNYTTSFFDDIDDKLAYFHEDVGLNSYYFLTKLYNLPWANDSQRKSYGQYLYHMMKQMAARYNLERYSNGLPELEGIDWDNLDISSFDPTLIYSNGNGFDQRIPTRVGDSETITWLKNMENNLQAIVVHMRDGGYDKSQIINHLMEVLVTGEKSYMSLALQFLSNDGLLSNSPPVLMHYMTSVRDPLFWKLNKKIVDLVDDALQVLPSYSRSELYFPGVEVQNIEVKKMMTTFDNFMFDVTNALKTEGVDSKFEVKISQSRLNHKPFSFKITVSSLVAQKALVKIYIGPKVMPGELVENKNLFMLLDNFEVNLKIGSNVLSRASNEMTNVSEDLLSLETLHKLVLDAEFGVNALPRKSVWSQLRFPSRLIIPKGTSDGLPLHVFVFVAPYVKATIAGSRTGMDLNTDAILSPGYPLDLSIEMQELFSLPNAMVKDVTLTHKSESTSYDRPVNNYNSASNNRVWPIDDQEPEIPSGPLYLSARPEFTKKTFDYKSKKNQYGKKTDYAAKRGNYNNYQRPNEITFDSEDDKIKVNTDVNNIYLNQDSKHDMTQGVKNDETVHKVVLDKGNTFSIDNFETYTKNIDKKNDIKPNEINHKLEPETMDIVNNIYISRDSEYDKVDNDDDITNYKVLVLDKDHLDDFSLDTEWDKGGNNDFDKVVEIKNSNVKPHGLLNMPRRKMNNYFNIFFKPSKTVYSEEELYE